MRFSYDRVRGSFEGAHVLVTGHTGFKGGWLSVWLSMLGARVSGASLEPDEAQQPLFDAVSSIVDFEHSAIGDLAADGFARRVITDVEPDIVFHLAAQPLVRRSYENPVETFVSNVIGTAAVLDACRGESPPTAVVCVTSDKCYENTGQVWPYRESDPVGGHDPYSASKGAAEIVIASFRSSYFSNPHTARVASARAGNVIGAGDHSADRLVPDFFRAVADRTPLELRYPTATRPWQHVVESLSGYLVLAAALVEDDRSLARAWNFGPAQTDIVPVGDFVALLSEAAGDRAPVVDFATGTGPHEASLLSLDTSAARFELGWEPLLTLSERARLTADGYLDVAEGRALSEVVADQISGFATRWEST